MNSFLCLSLLFAVASAVPKPQPVQWAYSVQNENLKSGSWYDGASYVPSVAPNGYWPSVYSVSSFDQQAFPKSFGNKPISSGWKVEPSSWSDVSSVPQSWSAGYYSAGIPAKIEKQIVAKKVEVPVKFDQVQPAVESVPKLISYTTEITHDVPSKREEVASIVSAPVKYSAWTGEVKPVAEIKPASWASEVKPASWASEVKPASWASEVKPASWVSEVKPASWSSEVKPVGWTSEVKPASWSWAEPKPASWAAWAPEAKPASWSSWSEAKPWSSYVSPIQPAFYGASWAQPTVSTNAHHAISAPWSSTWSSAHPISWTEPIQKRSERKPF